MGDEKPVYGIVTTTDIRDKIIIAERNPAETRVREVMTSPVVIADPAWSLRECSLKMHETGIHHMPVADEYGVLVGHDLRNRYLPRRRRDWLGQGKISSEV